MLAHYTFRDATPDDRSFLLEMLRLAIGWRTPAVPGGPPPAPVPVNPFALDGFGRSGDGGVIAVRYGEPAGACWWRLSPADEGRPPGFGFAGPGVPELTLAVGPLHRGFGLGGELLRRALERARADGVEAISLSVEPDNPARGMYVRRGFEVVSEVGGSLTMRKALSLGGDS